MAAAANRPSSSKDWSWPSDQACTARHPPAWLSSSQPREVGDDSGYGLASRHHAHCQQQQLAAARRQNRVPCAVNERPPSSSATTTDVAEKGRSGRRNTGCAHPWRGSTLTGTATGTAPRPLESRVAAILKSMRAGRKGCEKRRGALPPPSLRCRGLAACLSGNEDGEARRGGLVRQLCGAARVAPGRSDAGAWRGVSVSTVHLRFRQPSPLAAQ